MGEMRFETVTVREGELLCDVDWSHNFRASFDGYCCSDEGKQDMCDRTVELLRQIEFFHESGKQIIVNTRGYWHELIAIGMYDGWPYWKPMPALLVRGPLGTGEWNFFYDLQDVKIKQEREI